MDRNNILLTKEDSNLLIPTVVYMVFVELLSFDCEWKPMEKVLWEIPFKFKGHNFQIAYMKFGLKLFSEKNNLDKSVEKNLIGKLKKLISLADGVLEEEMSSLIEKGNFTVKNEYNTLYNMYKYFRDNADLLNNKSEENYLYSNLAYRFMIQPNEFMGIERRKFYYTYAMIDSFFSLLEHICVLMIALDENYDCEKENIKEFIFDTNWANKYKMTFEMNNESKASPIYQKLLKIKEKYRNPFAHGAFEKEGKSLFVHVPNVGAVPIALSKYNDCVTSSYLPVEDSYEEIVGVLDEFFYMLKTDNSIKNKYLIIKYLDSIIFSKEYKAKYLDAIISEVKVRSFIEEQCYIIDKNNNMEW